MGLRQGECFGLTVDRVDFLRRQVRIDRQLIAARDGVPEFGPPKSKAGFRTVPMPDEGKLSLPGFAFAVAIRSASERNGESGRTLRTKGYDVSRETIATSTSGSNGICFSIAACTG